MVVPAFLTGRAGAAVHELEGARSSALKMSLYLDDIGDGGSSAMYVPLIHESLDLGAHMAAATPGLRKALGAEGAATFVKDVAGRLRTIDRALVDVGGPTNEHGELPRVLAAERVADGLMHAIDGQIGAVRSAAHHTAITRGTIGALGLAGAASGAVTLQQSGVFS
ncbi:MAG: hypothetical protein JWM98_2370 [Thermoleophilia bacterium]|nr:hypothetical protein [Thermoleophilia bacterium]